MTNRVIERTPLRLSGRRHGGPAGSGRRFRPGRGPSNPSAGRVPPGGPDPCPEPRYGGGGRRRARHRWRVLRDPARPARGRRSEPDTEHAPQPQPARRRGSELDPQRATGRPVRRRESGRRLDPHRDDGHASRWPHGGAAARWQGARGGRRATSERPAPPRSCTTRTAEPGPPPGTCQAPPGFPATLLRDGKVLVGDIEDPPGDSRITGAEVYDPDSGTWAATGKMVECRRQHGHAAARRQGARDGRRTAPSCTTRTAGPGPPPGRWSTAPRPRGHPAARWQGARGGRPRSSRRRQPRPSCTIPPRGRGPRSRRCTSQGGASRPRCCATARCS